jgi:hypothetical protein
MRVYLIYAGRSGFSTLAHFIPFVLLREILLL